jgi:predicted phosphoribosyltransferase
MRFSDRRVAGRALAARLAHYAGAPGVTVLALPRGGIPVGFEVARALGAPLDAFVVHKLGVPGHEELAMGAVASGGAVSVNREVVEALGLPEKRLQEIADSERAELAWREHLYRQGRRPLELKGRTVILVDDGLATGSTMLAAILAVDALGPARLVVAAPVAPAETLDLVGEQADEVVCVEVPADFQAVGQFYEDFAPVEDAEVTRLLRAAETTAPTAPPPT